MPEISQEQLDALTRGQNLLNKMWNDPKTGMAFKKKVKEFVPDAKIPELDIVDGATAPIFAELEEQKKANKTLADRLDNWETSQKNSKEESELQTQLDAIRKQYSFTPEGMQKVVDRMKEKNNPDADAAAAWVAAQERKARPVTPAFSKTDLNLYGASTIDESMKELHTNPERWAVNEMEIMLNEFAQQDAA
jgi:hypothetical protein